MRRAGSARLLTALALGGLVSIGLAAAAQGRRGFGGGADPFGQLRAPVRVEGNVPYDGRFTFVRVSYETLPGGYWYRGQPAWSHGYPVAERNLMKIMDAITALAPHVDEVNTLALSDRSIFEYPILYIIEPSWWQITDAEAVNLRAFMAKGGFVIVDDFKMPGAMGGRGWDQFAENMQRVLPDAQFVDMQVSDPIFHVFFDINDLDIVPQAYNAGRPVFKGLYEHNDPAGRLQMIVNYNTDISQFWEWSERGLRPIDQTNEAYKLGVNYLIYGLTH
jgi:hypothetical protein